MTEADIAVQKDPYRLARNEAGEAGPRPSPPGKDE
jgi:hypothetical protein